MNIGRASYSLSLDLYPVNTVYGTNKISQTKTAVYVQCDMYRLQ